MHLPVLLREAVDFLAPERGRVYVDATVGLGGHAEEILKRMGGGSVLVGLDRDDEALKLAGSRFSGIGTERVILKKAKFSHMEEVLRELDIKGADGVLFDLGVSMLQLKGEERGFSFTADEPLDMRMDKAQPLTAREVVNTWPEEELARIIWEYGEERFSRRIARGIVRAREQRPIETTRELAGIAARFYRGWHRIHPATRTFQALRIAVNNELEELKDGLEGAKNVLNPGGRLCVISYHSLEDRIVKRFFKAEAEEGSMRILTKKPVVPAEEETAANPAARSAKLRAAERVQ